MMKRTRLIALLLVIAILAGACAPSAGTNNSAAPTLAVASPQALQATQAVAATGGATPAGGTPAASTGATSSGQVVQLQFWHAQNQAQQKALDALIQDFNNSHPDIHVTGTYQGTYSDIYKKVTAAIAAGSPPDLAIAYPNDVSNYIKSDAVVPLDSFMKDPQIGFSSADLQDIFPSFIDHYPQAGNQVYSLAFMRSMEVMYYNADMLQAAGFNQPPANWDDFLKVCAAVSKPPSAYCYEMNTDASRFANWVWGRGGEILSPDGKTVAFDSQAGLDTLNWLSTMFKQKYAIVIGKAFQDQTDFALGKIAFAMGSTAGLPYYKQAVDQSGKLKNWAIAPFPHTTANPAVDVYGPSVTIFKTTPEKERAAFIFLKWLMGNGPNAQWVKATAYFPARASTKVQLADFIQANPLYGEAYGWLQYGKTEPTVAAWNPIRTYIADTLTAVANSTQTPDAALKALVQKSNQALAAQ
jgi:ABC-type glycerol-3-phosphate transport system substrate-binding protein